MSASTPTDESPVPGLDAVAARRWRLRNHPSSPWLSEEVAARMAERLTWIKAVPEHWVNWAPVLGGLQGHDKVAAQYPHAQITLAGDGADQAARYLRAVGSRGWNPFRWFSVPRAVDLPAPGEADMLWANMSLHLHPLPRALLRQWHQALRFNGYLMFSCLGPDTLIELRAVFDRHGWSHPHHAFTDMHDWGDMLVEVGFAEPVMDMERLQLAYPNARRLLQDLREAGRNLDSRRFQALRGCSWRSAVEAALEQELPRNAAGQLLLTVEVVYGHAFKPTPRVKVNGTSTLSVQDMRAMLRQSRQG